MFSSPPGKDRNLPSRQPACPSYKAFFGLLPDRKVRIFFLKRSLSSAAIQYYFGEGHFIMSTPFELPSDLLKVLGIDYYRIAPGNYPIQEDHEYITVDF